MQSSKLNKNQFGSSAAPKSISFAHLNARMSNLESASFSSTRRNSQTLSTKVQQRKPNEPITPLSSLSYCILALPNRGTTPKPTVRKNAPIVRTTQSKNVNQRTRLVHDVLSLANNPEIYDKHNGLDKETNGDSPIHDRTPALPHI